MPPVFKRYFHCICRTLAPCSMSTEIEIRTQELATNLSTLEEGLSGLGLLDGSAKASETNRLTKQVERTQREYKMVEMEIRILQGEQKIKWRGKLKELNKQLKAIEAELKHASSTIAVNNGDAAESGNPDPTTETEMAAYGVGLMEDIDDTGKRILRDLNDADEVAQGVMVQLEAQGEALSAVQKDIYEIADSLDRSKAIATMIARRLMTDKLIGCLSVLIVLLIIAIIAYKNISGNDVDTSDQLGNA